MNVLDHKEHGDSVPTVEAVYDVLDADYNVYRNIHQSINLALLARLRAEGIEFTYPTQTLYVHHTETGLAGPAGGTP